MLYHRPFSCFFWSLVKWLVSHGHITRGACFLFGSFEVAPSGTSSAHKTGSELLGSRLSLPSGCCGRWNWLWKNNTVSQLYPGGRLGCVGGRVHGSGSLVDCLSAEIIQSLRPNGVGCGSVLKCNSIDSQKRTRWAPMRSPTAWRQPLQKVEEEKCQLFALSRLAARFEKIWWLKKPT